MQAIEVVSHAWTPIVFSSDVDTIVQAQGPMVLYFGTDPGTDNFGVSADSGYQIIAPAGVNVYARASGGPSTTAVVGPFGVAV